VTSPTWQNAAVKLGQRILAIAVCAVEKGKAPQSVHCGNDQCLGLNDGTPVAGTIGDLVPQSIQIGAGGKEAGEVDTLIELPFQSGKMTFGGAIFVSFPAKAVIVLQ